MSAIHWMSFFEFANYNFESCVHFREVFNEFDSFLLSEDSYMSPGYVEFKFCGHLLCGCFNS